MDMFAEAKIRILTERATSAEARLRERDLVDARAKAEQLEAERKTVDAKQRAEQAEALAGEIEQTRRGAWVNHFLKSAVDEGRGQQEVNVQRMLASIPASVWPPGVDPTEYSFVGQAPFGRVSAGSEGNTMLHKLAREKGLKL